jgi:hypothetical protein
LVQSQLQKKARCSTAIFPKMFMFREVLPVPKNYNVTPPLPQELPFHLVLPLYMINSLAVEVASVSPGPSFMHVWSSVCCLFLHLPLPLVRFLEQAYAGCKTGPYSGNFTLCGKRHFSDMIALKILK